MPRALLPALLATALLGGCLEARSTTILKADGTGTYREIVVLDVAKARGFREALAAQMRELPIGDDPDFDDPFDELDVGKRQAALAQRKGVRVTSRSQSEDAAAGTRTFELAAAFDSLKALFEAGVIEDAAVKLAQSEDRTQWTLTIRHVYDGNIRDPESRALEELARLRKAMLARYRTWWGSLKVERVLTLPTPVLATNGTKEEDGRTVRWMVGFDDLADPKRLRQVVTFAHDASLKLVPFEVTVSDFAAAKDLEEIDK